MAKANDTETASAAEASEEDTTEAGKAHSTGSGQAGMTVEERLKARGALAEEPTPAEDGHPSEGGEQESDEDTDAEDTDADTDEEDADAEEGAEKDGEIEDGEVEGLSAKAQAKVNKRIHELNIKRKNAEAQAEQTESQMKVLAEKIQDANIQAAMKAGFDPNYITADEAKTLNRVEHLRAWRNFYRDHRVDGYEGSGKGDDQSLTPAEVVRRLDAIEDELLEIGGPARKLASERLAQKDADAAVGRKLRLAAEGKPPADTKPPIKKVNPKPPKIGGGDGATRRPPVSSASKGKPVFDKEGFEKEGGDQAALQKTYEKLYGG